MTDSALMERAAAVADFTKEARRALHRIPERGFSEHKTLAFIHRTLESIGVPYTSERTWTIAAIEGGKPGKTVALRADIDALPILEKTGLPFQSEHEGFMHACGHDAHAAILLGTAKLLWAMRDEIPGTVRLLFQPAEETVGGAVPMIAAGAMRGVDAVYALHVAAQAPVGRIAAKPGPMYAASDEFFIDILGVKGHGAHPRSGVDAIAISAQVIGALQQLVTRETEATDSVVITIGSIHGGSACNILCDEVKLHGTLRTLTQALRDQFQRRIAEVSEGIARAMGGGARVRIAHGYCACINDEAEAARVERIATRLFGEDGFKTLASSSMGAEDFAFFLREAPGAIYHLGCGSQVGLHNECFVLDEDCLVRGVAMHAALVMSYLGGE